MKIASFLQLKAPAVITATDTGAGVDVSSFRGNGYIVLSSAAMTAGTSSTVTIEHSSDNSTFTAVTVNGAALAFTPVTTASAAMQSARVCIDELKKYVRVVNTLAGTTPSVAFGVSLVGNKDQE